MSNNNEDVFNSIANVLKVIFIFLFSGCVRNLILKSEKKEYCSCINACVLSNANTNKEG